MGIKLQDDFLWGGAKQKGPGKQVVRAYLSLIF